MSSKKKQGKRNYGYGRRMDFAGTQVLRERFGHGHFGSTAAHSERWRCFTKWTREHGVNDMCDINPELVHDYAEALKSQELATSTVQNRISTINVVMGHAREDWKPLSPREKAGKSRRTVRLEAPASLDRRVHDRTVERMKAAGMDRAAAIADLARNIGVRGEEAIKANLDRWQQEGDKQGAVNVIDGTKGGRDCDRWVPLSAQAKEALNYALSVRPAGSKNLLSPDESYKSARNGWVRKGREMYAKSVGDRGYHDARSAYACERYQKLTGCNAPVFTGEREADKGSDYAAREIIAMELGHGRTDVVASYVGSRQ